jgi:pyruvate/2-oxoglutarate dehydrogenase complex dihydrolipoamide acyltransferase (E2) component
VLLGVVRGTLTRLFAAVVLAGAVTTTVATVAPVAAFADSSASMESQFVAKMNAARQSAGLRPYAVASDLTSIARQHSAQMASRQELYHNPNLTTQVQNWQAVGENVGEGPTVSDIHNAFMQSPEHKANILDHDFTQVGVGVVVDKNGIIWVTEDFRQPMRSSSSPAPTHHSAPKTTTTHQASAPKTSTATHAPTATTTSTTPSSRPVVHPHPTVAASPQARLLAKLAAMRTAGADSPSPDPVAAAFDYLSTVTDLTTAGA